MENKFEELIMECKRLSRLEDLSYKLASCQDIYFPDIKGIEDEVSGLLDQYISTKKIELNIKYALKS